MTDQNANDKKADLPAAELAGTELPGTGLPGSGSPGAEPVLSGPPVGVDFPVAAGGWRSTSAFGRGVIADALRRTDPVGTLGAEQETNWRSGYLTHFRRVIEAGLTSKQAALSIAADGLAAVHGRMRVGLADCEHELAILLTAPASRTIRTATVTGTAEAVRGLSLPYRGQQLRGADLTARPDAWVTGGIIEPSCADAVNEVSAHPEWLSLPGRTVVVLGAGSEIGPLPVLLGWGATVAGIDLARPRIWERVVRMGRSGAGTLLVPSRDSASGDDQSRLARTAGADLVTEVPEIADWLAGLDGPLVLGNYVYADGAANVRVCAAADALTLRLQAARNDIGLAFLATPTDVFAVPAEAVAQPAAAYAGAHRFGAEIFEPDTTRVLMAALLVHDLATGGGPAHDQPWQDEAYAAAHGGLWRIAWAPRSALGLAALLGYGATRG